MCWGDIPASVYTIQLCVDDARHHHKADGTCVIPYWSPRSHGEMNARLRASRAFIAGYDPERI